jgi:hypothetical protein
MQYEVQARGHSGGGSGGHSGGSGGGRGGGSGGKSKRAPRATDEQGIELERRYLVDYAPPDDQFVGIINVGAGAGTGTGVAGGGSGGARAEGVVQHQPI